MALGGRWEQPRWGRWDSRCPGGLRGTRKDPVCIPSEAVDPGEEAGVVRGEGFLRRGKTQKPSDSIWFRYTWDDLSRAMWAAVCVCVCV